MSSQRPGRHQRRASQSVFVLPENFAALDDVPVVDSGGEHRKAALDGRPAEQQARPTVGRHQRAMSVAMVSRNLEMIEEDIGSYKIGS